VEFVLVLPVIIALLFGAIEIGRLLHDFHVISKGVRDGARYLSRVDVDCSGGVGPGTFSDPVEQANGLNLVMTGSIDAPGGPSDYLLFAWTHGSTTLVPTVDCNPRGTLAGIYPDPPGIVPTVTVTASVRYDFIGSAGLLPAFIQIPFSHTEAHIGD
jgi:hypothetical protein